MKTKSIGFVISIVGALALSTACSEQVNVLPLPDFGAEMVKISPLKGNKFISNNPTNPAATLREATVEILPSAKNVLIVRDSALQFQIQLSTKADEVSSNAVYFTIPEQVVRYNNQNTTVKGVADKLKPSTHGLFIWKDKGTVVNSLSFVVAVGTRQWTYAVEKK